MYNILSISGTLFFFHDEARSGVAQSFSSLEP